MTVNYSYRNFINSLQKATENIDFPLRVQSDIVSEQLVQKRKSSKRTKVRKEKKPRKRISDSYHWTNGDLQTQKKKLPSTRRRLPTPL